jgi:hypothetical protein
MVEAARMWDLPPARGRGGPDERHALPADLTMLLSGVDLASVKRSNRYRAAGVNPSRHAAKICHHDA